MSATTPGVHVETKPSSNAYKPDIPKDEKFTFDGKDDVLWIALSDSMPYPGTTVPNERKFRVEAAKVTGGTQGNVVWLTLVRLDDGTFRS